MCVGSELVDYAVKTITSEELYIKSRFVCLSQEQGCFLCIEWKEYKICACFFHLLDLYREVLCGILCESFCCNNIYALIRGFFLECLEDAVGVYVG